MPVGHAVKFTKELSGRFKARLFLGWASTLRVQGVSVDRWNSPAPGQDLLNFALWWFTL